MVKPTRSKLVWTLSLLLLASAVAHFMVAGIEHPTHFVRGEQMTYPKEMQPFSEASETFRVATYNIQRSKGLDGERDIERTASVFNQPDLVALQEVSGTRFYGAQNQAQQIAEKLKIGWLFAPAMTRWYQPYKGNALLSRFDIKRWSIEPLPRDIAEEKLRYRNLITATASIKGRDVTILATHIARRDDAQRAFVLERFRQTAGPVILLGDLNASIEHEQIQDMLADSRNTDAVDIAIGPFWRLDWIITRGFTVTAGGYTPRGISDHAHYWVDLKFNHPHNDTE